MEENQVSDAVVPQLNNSVEQQAPAVKMIPQDEVNRIVAREKQRAGESVRREYEERQQQQQAQQQPAQQTPTQQQSMPREVSTETADEERFNKYMQKRQQEAHAQQIADAYHQNIGKGKESYQDFDEVTKNFDPTKSLPLTYLIANNPNAADILYEISKNPNKFVTLHALAEINPQMAQTELSKLSKSIKDNKEALDDSQSQSTSEPLDRMTPSRVAGSNGKMSINDYRKQPWLRG